MRDKELNCKFVAINPDECVRLERIDLVLGEHFVELIDASDKDHFFDAFIVKDEARQCQRLAGREDFFCVAMKRGFSRALGIRSVREMLALVAGLPEREHLLAIKAAERPLPRIRDRGNMPRNAVTAASEGHFEICLASWLRP